MKNKEKMNLEAIKVRSFVTTLNRDQQEEIKGGADVREASDAGTTSPPIFC
jgi:hypothetical protein